MRNDWFLKGRTVSRKTRILAAKSGGLEPAVLPIKSGTASPDATGTLAFTTGGITFAGSGLETITGTLTATLGTITFAGSGLVTETGTLSFTTAGITFAGNGSVSSASVDGILAFTTGDITFAGSGTETETGTLAFTTESVQFAGSGLVTETGILAFTTDSIAFAGSGTETITGALGATLDGIQFVGNGNVVTADTDGTLAFTTEGISFVGRAQIVYARDTHDGFTKREQRKSSIKKRDEKLKQEILKQFERIIEGKIDNPQEVEALKGEIYSTDHLDKVLIAELLAKLDSLELQLIEIDEDDEESLLMLM